MSKLISDETLYHYGFKGMKCGFNKGKRNGKRVAEEGEMGPYTKDRQEVIDMHKGLKAFDDEINEFVGPLTFDAQGNPSFEIATNNYGNNYGLSKHIQDKMGTEYGRKLRKLEEEAKEADKFYEKFSKDLKDKDKKEVNDILERKFEDLYDKANKEFDEDIRKSETYTVTKSSKGTPVYLSEKLKKVLKNMEYSRKNNPYRNKYGLKNK